MHDFPVPVVSMGLGMRRCLRRDWVCLIAGWGTAINPEHVDGTAPQHKKRCAVPQHLTDCFFASLGGPKRASEEPED
jgi:hypothetical protein